MPRKTAKKTINISAPAATSHFATKISIGGVIAKILVYVLYLAFWFSSEICIRPLVWFMAMLIRAGIAYEFSLHSEQFFKYFTPSQETTARSLFFDLVICLPLMLFILWWSFTTILMFISALYGQFGHRTYGNEGEYSEFKKLADYANNKMRFQSYQENMRFLRGKK